LVRFQNSFEAYFSFLSSKQRISTLDSRIKVSRGAQLTPVGAKPFGKLLGSDLYDTLENFRGGSGRLSQKDSESTVLRLSSVEANISAMKAVLDALASSDRYTSATAMQEDAVRLALKIFGVTDESELKQIVLLSESALERVNTHEDRVIEFDAAHIPDLVPVFSDTTGYARYERDDEILEVYTANRLPLEQLLGVDLIYFNVPLGSAAMVQYKMLTPQISKAGTRDWIFRPDSHFADQLQTMERVRVRFGSSNKEYRLNDGIFYLKFVRRHGKVRDGGTIISLDHYNQLSSDRRMRGPRGGMRISWESLGGKYLRQTGFVDLVRSGYIGSLPDVTESLRVLTEITSKADRGLVAAIERAIQPA
jgi:hypothetical protein